MRDEEPCPRSDRPLLAAESAQVPSASGMPNARSSGDGVLSAAAVCAVRCAMQAHLQGRVPAHGMRAALRALCAEGRRRQLYVEQLLIVIKRVWASLPESQRAPHQAERGALERLVAACIEEFYAPGAARAPAAAAREGGPGR